MQWNWTLHSQGPDEPVYVIEADGTARFIARLDGEGKTWTEVMENGFLLAAAPALVAALEDLTDRVDLVLYASFVGHERIARARAAIAKAKGSALDHSEMVAGNEPGYAQKCAKCGQVHEKEDRHEESH